MLQNFSRRGLVLFGALIVQSQAYSQAPMPNITINPARLQASVSFKTQQFKPTDCAIVESCVSGSGKRSMLKFDVQTPNIGDADLYLGNPADHPELFIYSACHGHYHLLGYAIYELLKLDSTPVKVGGNAVVGHKQAFCLEDLSQVDPSAGPAKYTCSNQGISVGWSDVYGSYLDCQWIDITGVPSGRYVLEVQINPARVIREGNYSNNVGRSEVTVP